MENSEELDKDRGNGRPTVEEHSSRRRRPDEDLPLALQPVRTTKILLKYTISNLTQTNRGRFLLRKPHLFEVSTVNHFNN